MIVPDGAPAPGPTELRALEVRRYEASGSARLTALPAAAFFDGHFPGRPVLPAVAQLAIVEEALTLVQGHPVVLTAVDRLRCAQIVAPGERLWLALTWDDATSRATFVLSLDSGRASDGVVEVGDPAVGANGE